ncbi:hypothetical protein DFQ28_009009 [Apophysomyces sp. BC1034]|nr:hypothetical protein DFQ30_007564 [Apophysomyces sp. BC1015]KAG0176231.1 hypothetical protein DFQ29_006390 [Apophysomyces sp. BC1021]KAG0185667.1 hypothetical protein DFQ28_009009 [Apophysomyces sp. BC1034]
MHHHDPTNDQYYSVQDNNNSFPLFSQSFDPLQLEHPLNSSFPYLSFTNDSTFLNDTPQSPPPTLELSIPPEWDLYGGINRYDNNPLLFSSQSGEDFSQLVDKQSEQMFLNLAEQDEQAILLSDPNFLRQHQLLQDQQKAMEMRMEQQKQQKEDLESTSVRSDLSITLDQAERKRTATITAMRPDDYLSADANISHPTTTTTAAPVPAPTRSRVQPNVAAKGIICKPQAKRDINRRSQINGSNGRSRVVKPIPISSGSGNGSSGTSFTTTEVDHQRRFNELQARFRVNYARKPSQQQRSHTDPLIPASFSGASSLDLSKKANLHFGTSMPSSLEQALQSHPSASVERKRSFDQAGNLMHHGGGKTVAIPSTSSNAPSGTNLSNSFPSRTMPVQIKRVHRNSTSHPVDAEQHQRRLNDQLVKVNFDDITVSELKEMLRQRGKPAMGKKALLMKRLQEERDIITGARSRNAPSQPPTLADQQNEPIRPLSFQGTFNSIGSIPESPTSESPNSSMMLSNSPSSTFSLNRSIANMHIGSPPIAPSQHTRRFSPYAAPGSPRAGSSPKLQTEPYSSSLPLGFVGSPPNNYESSNSSMFSSGSSISSRMRHMTPNTGTGGRRKSYAPFTSSALATPDRDDDCDPFDDLGQQDANMEGLEWMDSSVEYLLQQGQKEKKGQFT